MSDLVNDKVIFKKESKKYIHFEEETVSKSKIARLVLPKGITSINSSGATIKIPNEVTASTFIDTDNDLNVVYCNNEEELFNDLGI